MEPNNQPVVKNKATVVRMIFLSFGVSLCFVVPHLGCLAGNLFPKENNSVILANKLSPQMPLAWGKRDAWYGASLLAGSCLAGVILSTIAQKRQQELKKRGDIIESPSLWWPTAAPFVITSLAALYGNHVYGWRGGFGYGLFAALLNTPALLYMRHVWQSEWNDQVDMYRQSNLQQDLHYSGQRSSGDCAQCQEKNPLYNLGLSNSRVAHAALKKELETHLFNSTMSDFLKKIDGVDVKLVLTYPIGTSGDFLLNELTRDDANILKYRELFLEEKFYDKDIMDMWVTSNTKGDTPLIILARDLQKKDLSEDSKSLIRILLCRFLGHVEFFQPKGSFKSYELNEKRLQLLSEVDKFMENCIKLRYNEALRLLAVEKHAQRKKINSNSGWQDVWDPILIKALNEGNFGLFDICYEVNFNQECDFDTSMFALVISEVNLKCIKENVAQLTKNSILYRYLQQCYDKHIDMFPSAEKILCQEILSAVK